MRLWTIHPSHLDAKGLVALWREALLAQKVLRGRTRGYRHHPQLLRFRGTASPVDAIAAYLLVVQEEATRRGYKFDRRKIARHLAVSAISETQGQLLYEWRHLRRKLKSRDPIAYRESRSLKTPRPHPLFKIIEGPVQTWEKR